MKSTKQMIPLSEPCITGNEWSYVKQCLDDEWVSSGGPFVKRFEREVARSVGSAHAVATINGTAALHVALLALGVRPDDEVIVSDLTFIAPANAIRYCNAHPVFMDADIATWHMDPNKLKEFLEEECELREGRCFNKRTGRRVRAVLPVHILGLSCDIEAIAALARAYGLKIVEDASEGIGVRFRGRHIGTFGDVGVFSFNGNKIITTGGGGMAVTDDTEIANRLKYLTTQAKDDGVEYDHGEIGFNYRLTNVQAAIGIAQMERLDEFIEKKRAIAGVYRGELAHVPGLTLMQESDGCSATYWLFTILTPPGTRLDDRKKIILQLIDSGVGVRPLWHPIHDLQPYRNCQAYKIENSALLYERAISLPSSVGLNVDQLRSCAKKLKQNLATL